MGVVLCMLMLWGCGADESQGPSGGGAGAGAGQTDPFGNPSAPGDFANPTQQGPQSMPAATTSIEIGDGDICDADNYTAEARRLDIYMMVDDSGSMVPWWPGTLMAINDFFMDPGSEGIGVGVQFFGSDCNAATYSTPRVAIAPLPGNITNLQNAFPPIPVEGTATVPAMQGAVTHAQQWATQNPEAKTVILLVTDGLPDDCGSDVPGVVQAVADGLNGAPSIQTFVIGLGVGLDALNMFAVAGGTDQAILVDPAAAGTLVAALNEIRGAALPCDYKLPDNNGMVVDLVQVNLRYQDPAGTKTTIGWVPDAASCDAVQGGWHYNAANDRLIACDLSCKQLKDVGGEVSVVVGCPRVEIPQ